VLFRELKLELIIEEKNQIVLLLKKLIKISQMNRWKKKSLRRHHQGEDKLLSK
jgi:hypothetical protein